MPDAEHEVVSHYRIEERIGTGASGTVFRAHDERLKRAVALKFLARELSRDEETRKRFVREAQAASALDHPNICTIFEIDETIEGQLFIAMAYYGGGTLDQVLRNDGPLEPARAIGFAIQTAKGLAAAHEELIVHRDIKPGNLVVTPHDTIKILDFGLAKLAGSPRLTNPDAAVGTPAYMSPEQLRAEPVDYRTDIWSLGVTLFEMLTVKLPFPGETPQALINGILNGEPRRLSHEMAGLPGRIDRVMTRSLAKSCRARYARIEEMIDDLQMILDDLDSKGITRRRKAEKRKASIAVLPFVDLSPGKDQEYFCDGIAEELLGALGTIPDLHVASRTSSFQFRGAAADVREIGYQLNVATVLEGSVRRIGDRVRVSAQLISVDDGFRLWYERFDRDLTDIFAIQDEIARSIAEALEVQLVSRERELAERLSTRDAEIYDLYLRGRGFLHQHRGKGLEVARQTFRRVIEADPEFARAWAGIAICDSLLYLYFGKSAAVIEEAEEASRRAVEIAPDTAESRVARGLALLTMNRADEAEVEIDRAVELNPSLHDGWYFRGRIFFSQGKIEEACRSFENACRLAPEVPYSWYLLGMTLRRLGDSAKAQMADLECIEAVRKHVDRHPEDTRAWTMGAAVQASLGEPEIAAVWVQRAIDLDPDEPMILYNAACVFVRLERYDDAIRCLEASLGNGGLNVNWVRNDPDLDPLREDERFIALLEWLAD